MGKRKARTARLANFNVKNEKLFRIAKFLAKFNIFAIPLYAILLSGWTLVELQRLVADVTMYMLTAAGMNPAINDLLISIPIKNGDWAAVINWDCTGWKSMLAFLALVMATDYPAKRKLAGLMLLPVIFAVNLLRIFFMFFYVKTFDLASYQLVHAVVWSWGLILTILILWIVWMKYDFRKIKIIHGFSSAKIRAVNKNSMLKGK